MRFLFEKIDPSTKKDKKDELAIAELKKLLVEPTTNNASVVTQGQINTSSLYAPDNSGEESKEEESEKNVDRQSVKRKLSFS